MNPLQAQPIQKLFGMEVVECDTMPPGMVALVSWKRGSFPPEIKDIQIIQAGESQNAADL